MIFKIAICDDVSADRQQLSSLIKAENPSYECTTYENGELLLWDFENGAHFDIFFLDIFMGGINGIEVARRIRILDCDSLIIFVSSSSDFYRESYDLYAFNYLLKPLSEDKLTPVLRRANLYFGKELNQFVRFSFNNSLHKVNCSQLLFMSSDKHIVHFHLVSGDTLKAYGKIDDFITQLPSDIFFRCHQSYIVNLKHANGMTTDEFIYGKIKIPISRKYRVQAREKYRFEMFEDF